MKIRSRRGSILLHILVIAVVVLIIATGIIRIVLMRSVSLARVQSGGQNKRTAEGALNELEYYWNNNNAVCSNTPTDPHTYGFTWVSGNNSQTCNCVLTYAGGTITITAGPNLDVHGNCPISVQTGS